MKVIFSLILCFTFCLTYSQDTYKKRYYVPESVSYNRYEINGIKSDKKKTLKLQVMDKLMQKTIIKDSIKQIVKYFDPRDFDFDEVDGMSRKNSFWLRIVCPSSNRLLANVLFEEDKVYINPWLFNSQGTDTIFRDKIFYYKLENRQSLKLHYRQWSLNALSVPLKLRFGNETEISTGANLGALIGHTWGSTNFLHRVKVGNKIYDNKLTFGLFLGADKLEFTYEIPNEVVGEEPVKETVKTAFLSTGIGLMYSYEKFTVGAIWGWDIGLGKNVDEWDYQKRPWLGLSLGYSLFSF